MNKPTPTEAAVSCKVIYDEIRLLNAEQLIERTLLKEGTPTDNAYAEALWHVLSSNHSPFRPDAASEIYRQCGYIPFSGLPLKRDPRFSPTGNIEWKDIKAGDVVTEHPNHFQVNGTHVTYWSGQEAVKAQVWLKRRARADLKRSEGIPGDCGIFTDYQGPEKGE